MMLLENGSENKHTDSTTTTKPNTTDEPTDIDTTTIDMAKYVVQQRDALRGIASKAPIKLNNAFAVLQTIDEDNDDDDDVTLDHEPENRRVIDAQAKKKVYKEEEVDVQRPRTMSKHHH